MIFFFKSPSSSRALCVGGGHAAYFLCDRLAALLGPVHVAIGLLAAATAAEKGIAETKDISSLEESKKKSRINSVLY